ncbi:hypothetical protein JCM19236_5133 [Vibrio sp. JCM 19236]|nr:hypothetical protein JCM19236_5133 [Vibrio sp. JCM 19236]
MFEIVQIMRDFYIQRLYQPTLSVPNRQIRRAELLTYQEKLIGSNNHYIQDLRITK